MSFDHCLVSLDLGKKLPVAQLREMSKKFTAVGISPDVAMRLVLNDQLEAHRTQERAIVAAVRSAWESQGRPGAGAVGPTAQRDPNQLDDLNAMFTELLAEEAAAKPKSDDLNAMFGELLAEVSGVDPRPTVAEVVDPKPAASKRRVKAKNRFATLEQEAERLRHLMEIYDAKYEFSLPNSVTMTTNGKMPLADTAADTGKSRRRIKAAEKELSFLPPGILTPEAMYNVRKSELATPEGRLEVARRLIGHLETDAQIALRELRQGDWKNADEAWADFTKKHKRSPHMTREYFDMLGAGVDIDAIRAEQAKAPKTEVGNEWQEPTTTTGWMHRDSADDAIGKPIKKLKAIEVYQALTKDRALTVQVAERIITLRPDLAAEVRTTMRDELGYRIKNGVWEKVGRGTMPARAMDHTGRPVDGGPVQAGDVFKTASGRETTEYPKGKGERPASEWLIENSKAEAKARGDDFNARAFGAVKPFKSGDLAMADRDSMLEYLFGQQPAVVPKITRPLAPAAGPALTGSTTPEAHIAKFAKQPYDVKNEQIRKILLDAGPMAPQVASIIGEQPHLVTEVGRVMEEFGYKFDGFDGPNMAPQFSKPGARSASDAAASAKQNAADGYQAAIAGLGALFGKSNSWIDLDESKYQQAVPFFRAAVQNFSQAAADIRDVMRAVIKDLFQQFGYEATANMQPYVVRFIEEYRAGKHQGENENADERTAGSTARDQEHRADEKPAAEQDIFDVTGAIDRPASGTTRQPDGAGGEQVDRAGVSGRDAVADREAGGGGVRERAPGSGERTTESRDAEGSGRGGRAGARPDGRAEGDAGNAADPRGAARSKLDQQRDAGGIPVQLGDRANIDATLPYLLEPQRGDVHFAEKRFAAAAEGKMPGVLFTNGTGTGKTATGAGIIARQVRAGKTEGIIVVPNTGIAKDWIEFAGRLGVELRMLDSTSENGGHGAVITTYANFGANRTLADRSYDWVLADESHYLMAAKDGDMTDALATFRALTRHPAGYAAYNRMQNRDIYDRLATITNKESPEAKELYRQLHDREGFLRPNYENEAKPAARPKAIFLSATPFAYIKSVDYAEGYLFEYPADGKIGNSNQDGRAHFFVQHFGYRIRYHKLTAPDGNVDVGLMARQFNSWLKREGALSGRMLEVDADYGRRFIKVQSALGEKIDEGMEFMREHPEYKHLYGPFMKQFSYLKRRYLLEAIKAREALPIIQQHLDLGRKVIIVHDYKKGGGSNPFSMQGINGTTTAYDASMSPKSIDLAALADKFKAERPDLVRLQFPSASALGTLRSAFPNALVHNGDIPETQLENNKRLFNDDNSGRNVIILQSDKGREGISLHDTTGGHQRVTVNIGMPAKPTALIQLEGRSYRTGQVTNAVFDYLNTGTAWERWTFAQTIAERTDIAEALAMGDDARALKDSIVEAFEDSGDHAITENDGTGGKARDRQAAKLLSDWDRAKSFYYGQLKRNSSTKALEGKDYFATPEPVGLKMVEWADIRPGEDVLEPSAGHGAIARWFPTLSNKTIVEPSTNLIGKARLVVDGGAKFVQSKFEDLNVVNKFDTIVMNPPFGSGGATAMQHLAKAYQHLRDGGRIVALIPTGPTADAKFEKFLYGDNAPKDLYLVADIGMPSSTFERAGTSVATRIVVLDRVSDPSRAPQQVSRNYVNAEDINDLFERIEHSSVPGRVRALAQPIEVAIEQQKPAPKKQPRQAAAGATGAERYYSTFELKHTKTGDDQFGAAMLNRVSDFKTPLAIAKKNGGYYSTYTGGGALRGFLFKTAEDRAAFMEEAGQLAEVKEGHDQADDTGTFENIDRRSSTRNTADRRTHTVQVDGQRRPIENANGQLLAEDMNKQLAFWRWAGDTKVVDEHGRPEVVYHGTVNGDIAQFEHGWASNTDAGGRNFYFSDSPANASSYAERGRVRKDGGRAVYPVYLALKNPLVMDLANTGSTWAQVDFNENNPMPDQLKDAIAKAKHIIPEQRHVLDGWYTLSLADVAGYAKQAGYDGVIAHNLTDGGSKKTMARQTTYVAFEANQIKSATGNSGRFDPASPFMAENIDLMHDSPLASASEPKRVATTQKLKKFRRQLEEGKITAEEHAAQVNGLIQDLDERNAQRDMPKDRERGIEWVEERLIRAGRTGELSRDEVAFARWLLADAPHLAEDLGISVRTPGAGAEGVAGRYNQISRVITLFKGHSSNETAVHEILHHTERMMPEAIQAKIVKAWTDAWARAYKKADPKTRALLLDMLEMGWSREASQRVRNGFRDGALDYDQHYQLVNPSEYWAVNATRLMKGRYEAGSWIGRAKRWLGELVEKAKGLLGLQSDAPVLAGLRTVLDGTGARVSKLMLAERGAKPFVGELENINRRQVPAASWSAPTDTAGDRVRHALQDKHIDMKRTVAAVRETIGDLGDKWNPYLQDELFHGRSATGFKDFLETELRPLLSDMQARGVSMDDLEEYLHMRHAGEANARLASINDGNPDGLAGVSTQDAADYLANLAPARATALGALANRVDAIIKGTQTALVDYGLEKQETIDAWNATYQHYVPLMRADMDNGQLGNGTGRGYSVRGAASKQRTGSKREVVDILANIAMAREKAITRGEKNRVSMALYGMALQAPNPEFWKPINPQKNRAALEAELLAIGLSPAEADAVIDAPKRRRINPDTGMVESYVSLADRNLPNVVAVRINGEDRFLFFNEKNDRALRMAQAINNVGEDALTGIMSIIASATRYFAAVNTQFNPVFGVVNLVRDVGEGSINLSSTPLAGKQAQVLAEAGILFAKVVKGRGRLSNLSGADLALWHEFQQEGGITGYRAMFTRSEDRNAELADELRRMAGGPAGKTYQFAKDWLSDYNEALENITRLSAYKVAKAQGLSNQQAASLAKNLTVNFNRKGAKTRYLGALYAFFNASVQGTARMAETLAGPAGKKIVAGGILLGVMQAIMLSLAGFDDDDLPEFIRAKNLIIPAGGKSYVTIPMPLGFSFLPTLGRIGTEFALHGGKQPGKYGARMLGTLLDTANPLGSSTVLQMVSPTFADPLAALAENKDWTGKDIARKDYSQLHPTPGHARAKENASAAGKALSRFFNAATGGTEYAPGSFSPTPDQIDYLIGQFTGGVGREAMKLQQTISTKITGEENSWDKVPLFGRFYGDVNDKSAISTKFYNNVKELADTAAEVDGRRKARVSSTDYRAEHPEWKLAEKSESVLRDLSELGQRRRYYLEKGDKVRVKEFELRIRTRMEKFNEEVTRQRAATP